MDNTLHEDHSASILPIYPDDDAPIREGYKVPLARPVAEGAGGLYAYFPDSVYQSTEAAYAAAEAWLSQADIDADDTRNIVRIEIPEIKERIKVRRATYGWQVRMRRQGKNYSQFFNDNHYGGKDGALKAAQYWRDWRDASLVKTDPQVAIEKSRQTRSQFGVPGLRVVLVDVGGGSYKPYLQASWPVKRADGTVRRKRKMFSLERHDPKKATIKLCQALVKAHSESRLSEAELKAPSSPFSVLDESEAQETDDLAAFEAALRKSMEAYTSQASSPQTPELTADAEEAPQRVQQRRMFMTFYSKALPAVERLLPEFLKKAEAQTAHAKAKTTDITTAKPDTAS